jgi:hypothetical protein
MRKTEWEDVPYIAMGKLLLAARVLWINEGLLWDGLSGWIWDMCSSEQQCDEVELDEIFHSD